EGDASTVKPQSNVQLCSREYVPFRKSPCECFHFTDALCSDMTFHNVNHKLLMRHLAFTFRSPVRVISGKFKSRRLKGTPPPGIRPTSDKLKETVFNILGSSVERAVFLDGCAGIGGIGIEAISRGAAFVYFVEQSRKACQIIRENLRALQVEEGIKILEMDFMKALHVIDRPLDLVFVDP